MENMKSKMSSMTVKEYLKGATTKGDHPLNIIDNQYREIIKSIRFALSHDERLCHAIKWRDDAVAQVRIRKSAKQKSAINRAENHVSEIIKEDSYNVLKKYIPYAYFYRRVMQAMGFDFSENYVNRFGISHKLENDWMSESTKIQIDNIENFDDFMIFGPQSCSNYNGEIRYAEYYYRKTYGWEI